MTQTAIMIILLALASVVAAWAVPQRWALDAVGIWTVIVLATIAPASALWLVAAAVITPLMLGLGERTGWRDRVAAGWSVVLLAAFIFARLTPGILWVGGAYFTLRALHVVGDWWMGRLAAPTVRAHLRYQLFLPVIVAGPIHRFETFERQSQRRRWDSAMFFSGMERALIGAFSAFVVGGYLLHHTGKVLGGWSQGWLPFFQDWGVSVVDWITLYFTFAGLTSIALGISLMIGLRLEENFDRPWAARNLIEFWTRWHMSLTRWCRDYVFRPVSAVTRNALAGLIMAMLAIGLWHEFSLYYLLWSAWQVMGVVITRLASRWLPMQLVPRAVSAVLGPVTVLSWLSLARPMIKLMEGMPI